MEARPAIAYTTQYLEHGGLEIPHMVVPLDHPRFDTDFLRAAYEGARNAAHEKVVATRAELTYVRGNTCLVCMPAVECFGDVVQSIEYPDLIAIPPAALDNATGKDIIVFMCHFLLRSGGLDCHFLGFCFRDGIGVCTRSPIGDDLLIPAGKLQSVCTLIAAVRARAITAPAAALPPADVSLDAPDAPQPVCIANSIDMMVTAPHAGGADACVPGAYIFCCFDNLSKLTGLRAFVEQTCARVMGRWWCYNSLAAGGEPGEHVARRLDTLFSAASPNDLAHELVAVFVLAIMLQGREDYFLRCELALMEYRVKRKLTDYDTRLRFLTLNGLAEKYARHQPECTHERFACLPGFVLDAYRDTLLRMLRIASFLMYDIPPEQMRPSVHTHVDVLTEIVESVRRGMRAAHR